MTKSEYMNTLREKLQRYNRALEMEILEDYEQHFAEGLAEGRKEEDIIAELGNIEDMLKEFSEEDLKQELEIVESQANQSNSYEQLYRAVVIEGLLADVEVTASEDDQIRIDYDNSGSKAQKMRYQFYQYEQDGVFYAGVKERKGMDHYRENASQSGPESIFDIFSKFTQFSNWSGDDIHLNVQIPAGIPAIKINNTSGDLWIQEIQTQELEAQCTSGDLRIEDVVCKKFFGKTQSGDVEVSGIAMRTDEDTEIDIHTTSGDLEAREISAARVRLKTISGDVSAESLKAGQLKIQTTSGEQDLEDIVCDRADMRSGSGDICLTLNRVKGASIVSRTGSGDMTIRGYEVTGRTYNTSYGSGACQVSLATGSGDINVE